MKQKKQAIPIHHIDTQTPLGLEFTYVEMMNEYDEIVMKMHKNVIHRDDYYLFLFMDTAGTLLTIDFEEIHIEGKSVMYIRPGQVHFVTIIQETRGWSLAIDSALVENDYKNTFEGQFLTQNPIVLDVSVSERMDEVARLLHATTQANSTLFSSKITLNLANVFIGIIAEQYLSQNKDLRHNKSRSAMIAHQFKELLSENFKSIKSPAQYAKMLNYSLSHLNESVKNVTGASVSYWIHLQVILEAKRLLYYTDLDVKEIAFILGYEDHTYFSRLFSKIEGMSALTFRRKFHE